MTKPLGEQNPAYTELEGRCGDASPFSMRLVLFVLGKVNLHTFDVQRLSIASLSKFHVVFAIDDKN